MLRKDEATVQIEFTQLIHETDAAYLFEIPTYADEHSDHWIPKSQVAQLDREGKTVEILEWLAVEKGLV